MGLFGGSTDRGELLALENRVARLEEQVARLSAALAVRPTPPEAVAEPPDAWSSWAPGEDPVQALSTSAGIVQATTLRQRIEAPPPDSDSELGGP